MIELSRRKILGASLAATATPLLPSSILAGEVGFIQIDPAISGHKFEGLAVQWCIDRTREKLLCVTSDYYFGHIIKLTAPSFKITTGPNVWSWMTGPMDEEGIHIHTSEMGIPLGNPVGVGTSKNYKDYYKEERPADLPEYHIRRAYLDFEELKKLKALLPYGHVDLDMRWMAALKQKNA